MSPTTRNYFKRSPFYFASQLKVISRFFSGLEEGKSLTFHNRCHLRTHILSHLELDGLSSVSLNGGPDSLQIFPPDEQELNLFDDSDDALAQGILIPNLTIPMFDLIQLK